MTDRGRSALRRSADGFTVGPSALHWDGERLIVDVDEVGGPPMVGRIRGRITLIPSAVTDRELPLTPDGAHVWRPFAPTARIDVALGKGWTWSGHGYLDANFGTRALEQDFAHWTWGRFPLEGGTACLYDADRLDGTRLSTAAMIRADGTIEPFDAPPRTPMRRSLWGVRRETRADPGTVPRQVKAMLDAPFYTRAVVRTRLNGQDTEGVHEALDLRRFRSPLIKPMLALRVPRRPRWRFAD